MKSVGERVGGGKGVVSGKPSSSTSSSSKTPGVERLVDPLASVQGAVVSLYSPHFDGTPDPLGAVGGVTPRSVGLYAGLARLETLLQRDDEEGGRGGKEREELGGFLHPGGGERERGSSRVEGVLGLPCPPSPPPPDPAIRTLQAALRACLTPPPLHPEEALDLAHQLEATPTATLTSGITPLHIPTLVTHNPTIAVAFLVALGAVGPHTMLSVYLNQLLPGWMGGGGSGGRGGEGSSLSVWDVGEGGRGGGEGGGGGGGGGGEVGGEGAGGGGALAVEGENNTPHKSIGGSSLGSLSRSNSVNGTLPSSFSSSSSSSSTTTTTTTSSHHITLRGLEVVFSLLQRSLPPPTPLHTSEEGGGEGATTTPSPPLTLPPSTHPFFVRHLSLSMSTLPSPTSPAYHRQVRLLCAYIRAVAGTGFLTGREDGSGEGGGTPLLLEAISFSLTHSALSEAAQLYKHLIAIRVH